MNALNRQVSRSLVYFGPKGRCAQTDRERFLLDRQLESKARQANRQPTKRTPNELLHEVMVDPVTSPQSIVSVKINWVGCIPSSYGFIMCPELCLWTSLIIMDVEG